MLIVSHGVAQDAGQMCSKVFRNDELFNLVNDKVIL